MNSLSNVESRVEGRQLPTYWSLSNRGELWSPNRLYPVVTVEKIEGNSSNPTSFAARVKEAPKMANTNAIEYKVGDLLEFKQNGPRDLTWSAGALRLEYSTLYGLQFRGLNS